MIEYAFLKDHVSGGLARRADTVACGVRRPRPDADGLHGRALRRRRASCGHLKRSSSSAISRTTTTAVVPGKSPALRRVPGGAGSRARGQAERSGPPRFLPPLQQPPVPARAADQGEPRRRDRLRRQRRLLLRPVARRTARRRRACTNRRRISSSDSAPRSTTSARPSVSSAASPRPGAAASRRASPSSSVRPVDTRWTTPGSTAFDAAAHGLVPPPARAVAARANLRRTRPIGAYHRPADGQVARGDGRAVDAGAWLAARSGR